jgi:hypothetical protein
MGDIGAEQSVLPRQVEPVVGIGFARIDRMVDAVHVRGDNDKPKNTVQTARQVDIRMIEKRRAVQQHLKQQDGDVSVAE